MAAGSSSASSASAPVEHEDNDSRYRLPGQYVQSDNAEPVNSRAAPVYEDNDSHYQLPGSYLTRDNPDLAVSVKAGVYGGSMERVARSMLGSNASQRDINNYVGQLLEINGINDPRRVQAGQDILLPDADTPAATSGLAVYGRDIALGERIKASAASSHNQLAVTAQQSEAQEPIWSFREAGKAKMLADYQARWGDRPVQYIGPVDVVAQRATEVRRESLLNFLNGQGNMALGGVFAAGSMIGSGDVVVASRVSDALAPIDSLMTPMGGGARVSSARVRGVRGSPSPLLPTEGKVGTYDDLIAAGTKGDNVTPHHIPSAKHMEQNYGIPKGDGISINMEMPSPGSGGRHRDTFNYGNSADVNMGSRDALAAGIRDARSLYQRDGLYDAYIRQQLQDVVRQNKADYPDVFKKQK